MTTACDDAIEDVSGLDDLFYDVTLTDESTGDPLETGNVDVRLCTVNTTAALHVTAATQALTHIADGRWTAVHDDANVLNAIAGLAVRQQFDRVLIVNGIAARKLARCRRVVVVE